MRKLIEIVSNRAILALIIWIFAAFCLSLQIVIHWNTFAQPFRREFMYNLYYHSQWVVPEHIQSIGDDGLYQVAGDQYVTKHNFYEINPEVPPLGKYFYGASIKLLGSAERGALVLFIASIYLFILLVRRFVKDYVLQGVAVLFYVTDPLLFYQATVSMLDLPQLVALFAHVLAIISLLHSTTYKQRLLWAIVAGLTLGMFVSIKIAILGGVILLADTIVLFKSKNLRSLVPLVVTMGLTYMMSYTMYFTQGNSIIDWLKAQKWMLSFYASSTIEPVFGTVFTTLLTGKIIGWDQGASWTEVLEWTISWTVYLLGFAIYCLRNIRMILNTEKRANLYLVIVCLGLLGAFAVLPFFTRYLVLLIPFLIVLVAKSMGYYRINLLIIFVIAGIFAFHYYQFWA